ncbi:hypothetical protein ACFSJ3_12010 [Corallincola platygyrae]|uniref:DUF2846 domain-containing protein n=1 Tax=Corallincola platygyrae TaxID=1193278 RepID=A0ABW4XM86_9GAMM
MKLVKLIYLLFVPLFFGCKSSGHISDIEEFEKTLEEPNVFVYHFLGNSDESFKIPHALYIEGIKIGLLNRDGYYSFKASPGRYRFSLREPVLQAFDELSVTLEVKEGETYYLSYNHVWVEPELGHNALNDALHMYTAVNLARVDSGIGSVELAKTGPLMESSTVIVARLDCDKSKTLRPTRQDLINCKW